MPAPVAGIMTAAARFGGRMLGLSAKAATQRDAKGRFVKGPVKAKVRTTLHAKAFVKFMSEGMELALDKIGTDMAEDIKESIEIRAPRPRDAGGRFVAKKYGRGSIPPAPPHYREGTLFRSIKHQVVYQQGGTTDNLVLRVGSDNVKYSLPLEKGTKGGSLKARPYIQPVLNEWAQSGRVLKEMKTFYKEWMNKVPPALK